MAWAAPTENRGEPAARAIATEAKATETAKQAATAPKPELPSMLPVASVVFMDPADGRFVLRELDCSWQGNRCAGFLPFEARRSHYLTVRAYRGRCPDVRLYRNGFEIDVERMRLEPCAFSMEADPD